MTKEAKPKYALQRLEQSDAAGDDCKQIVGYIEVLEAQLAEAHARLTKTMEVSDSYFASVTDLRVRRAALERDIAHERARLAAVEKERDEARAKVTEHLRSFEGHVYIKSEDYARLAESERRVKALETALLDASVTLSRLRPTMTLKSDGWDELEALHNRLSALTPAAKEGEPIFAGCYIEGHAEQARAEGRLAELKIAAQRLRCHHCTAYVDDGMHNVQCGHSGKGPDPERARADGIEAAAMYVSGCALGVDTRGVPVAYKMRDAIRALSPKPPEAKVVRHVRLPEGDGWGIPRIPARPEHRTDCGHERGQYDRTCAGCVEAGERATAPAAKVELGVLVSSAESIADCDRCKHSSVYHGHGSGDGCALSTCHCPRTRQEVLERRHFMTCRPCGIAFDMRDLSAVAEHMHPAAKAEPSPRCGAEHEATGRECVLPVGHAGLHKSGPTVSTSWYEWEQELRDFDPCAPIDTLPADIRRDIATERGHRLATNAIDREEWAGPGAMPRPLTEEERAGGLAKVKESRAALVTQIEEAEARNPKPDAEKVKSRCHRCCVRPATHEAVLRRATWQKLCDECMRLDDDPASFVPPDGRRLPDAGEARGGAFCPRCGDGMRLGCDNCAEGDAFGEIERLKAELAEAKRLVLAMRDEGDSAELNADGAMSERNDMEAERDAAKKEAAVVRRAMAPFITDDAPSTEAEVKGRFWRTVAISREQHDAAVAALEAKP